MPIADEVVDEREQGCECNCVKTVSDILGEVAVEAVVRVCKRESQEDDG